MADPKKHDDDLAADHDQDDEARRRRLKAAAAREELEEEEDDEEEEEEEEEDDDRDHEGDDRENDPTWWLPHAVMGTLIFLGILGVLGVFPRVFGPKKAAAESTTGATTAAAAATAANPASSIRVPPTRPVAPPGESIGAQHLLVMHKEGMRAPPGITRTKDEAKKRAEEALDKLKKGTAFDALVKEYTDEPGAKDKNPPGDLGTFGKGRMVPAFETAAFALKPNETSGVVESPFGYHIIKRLK